MDQTPARKSTGRVRIGSVAALAAVVACGWPCGCSRDVRLDKRELREVSVRTVTHYGLTLDQAADPESVAFVALSAIREDFEAGGDKVKREAALDKQFDVCAAEHIASQNHSSRSRAEFLLSVVRLWTPTVAHYVGDFPKTMEEARSRLVLRKLKTAEGSIEQADVLMEVDDLATGRDPNARVVLAVYLLKDGGYWRVTHVGFDTSTQDREARRRIASRRTPPAPANANASP